MNTSDDDSDLEIMNDKETVLKNKKDNKYYKIIPISATLEYFEKKRSMSTKL